MKRLAVTSLLIAQASAASAQVQEVPQAPTQIAQLGITVAGIENGKRIPNRYAFCIPDGNGRTVDGENYNPAISWSVGPVGTRSYALLVVDKDVPASFDAANKPDQVIANDFPRQDFYHWVLVDIPASMSGISEGADSRGITAGGKPPGRTEYGGINGHNDYAHEAKMGQHAGYDGSCPPWNDQRLHRYHFTVYALDVPTLGLSGNFGGAQAEAAMEGHILAKGEVIGTFTNNYALLSQ